VFNILVAHVFIVVENLYMKGPKVLCLVRHGESEANILSSEERTKLDQSTNHYALTETGRWQAYKTGQYLQDTYGTFDVHYSSFCKRATDSLAYMYPGAQPIQDARIAEAQRGIRHVHSDDDITTHYPLEDIRREREGFYYHRPFGGENWADLELRIHSFIETLFRKHKNQKVLVVTHGHWLIAFDRIMKGFSTEETIHRYKHDVAPNASVTTYTTIERSGNPDLVLQSERVVPWQQKAATQFTPLSVSQYQHQAD